MSIHSSTKGEKMIKEIETRRSIRKYVDKEVTKEELLDLLHAAMHSPTARNLQEWRFYVSNNREALDKVASIPAYQMLLGAKAMIVVCGDKTINSEEYCFVDCAAATQTILLEAASIGLGTCWCAIEPRKERSEPLKDLLHLDDNIFPVALISIGYPGEEKGVEDRFDENKITWL